MDDGVAKDTATRRRRLARCACSYFAFARTRNKHEVGERCILWLMLPSPWLGGRSDGTEVWRAFCFRAQGQSDGDKHALPVGGGWVDGVTLRQQHENKEGKLRT